MPPPALLLEALTLFILLPLAFRFAPFYLPPLPLLWAAALYAYLTLRHDPTFPTARLWNPQALPSQLLSILSFFTVIGLAIVLATARLAPRLLFIFVRARPVLWAAVMVLYPILSVYPQGLLYRAFLMHRYAGLLAGPHQRLLLILASAAAFGFMHIVFRNPLAVGMTFLGGLLFAWRYQTTGSLATSAFEHALYGCLLFTAGLGQFFYLGRARLN